MPTLDEIIQGEIDKRDAANSLLQYPAEQLPWEPPPADEDAQHAEEDTTRDQLEKPRTLDDSDIGNAPPPPAKPEPLPPRKSALAEEAWTGKGSYWTPLTDPSVQAPAQDVTSPEGLDVGEAPAKLTQVERAELVKMPDQLSPEAQAAQDKGEMVVASPALPSGPPPADTTQPAPGTLDQVERAQLVKMPDKLSPEAQAAQDRGELVTPETPPGVPRGTIQPAPATLTQVERGDLVSTPPGTAPKAIGVAAPVSTPPASTLASPDEPGGTHDNPYFIKSSADLGSVGAGQWYVDPADGSMKQKSGAATVQPPTQPPAKQSTLKATGSTFVPVDPTTGKELPTPPAAKQAAPTAQYTQPDGTPYPERIQAVDGSDPAAFIAHHTSGRGTVDGVVSTLRERHLGVEYVMDRNGQIYATGPPGSSQILPGWGSKGTGLNNQNTVGMEIIAKDDADVTEAQKRSFAQFIATRYPNTPIFGHGEVNPGHKEADEGASTKAAALALRASVQTVPTDQTVPVAQPTKGANGLYANEKPKDFVTGRSTNFASQSDIQSGQDSGVGSPKLGRLATSDVAGVAVPEWVLVNKFGNNPAAWRKARADVVGPDGRRLRLPIVDLGPGSDQENAGVVVDMTPSVSRFFGGDGNVAIKLVGNAGPDVTKNPQGWVDEQAAIKQGFDSASAVPGAVKTQKPLPYTYEPVDTKQATAAQQANLDSQTKVLGDLVQKNTNPAALYKMLTGPDAIPGISDGVRQEFAKNYKAQVTKEAQSFYNEPDPDKAFARATSGAGSVEFAQQLGRQFFAKTGNLDVGVNKFFANADDAQVNNFINTLVAAHPDLKGITEIPPENKAAFTKWLYGLSPDDRAKAIGTMMAQLPPAIQGSMSSVSIADAADRLANPQYQAEQTKAIQTKQDFLDKTARSDPNFTGTPAEWWTDHLATLGANTLTAFIPAPVRNTLWFSQFYADGKDKLKAQHPDWSDEQLNSHAAASAVVMMSSQEALANIIGGKLGGLTEGIANPFVRAGARALTETAAGTAGAVVGQAGANIAEAAPVTQGLGQAAIEGAFQAGFPGLVHGAHEISRGTVTRPEPVPLPPEPLPPEPAERSVSRADILGPETEQGYEWYKPGPIVTRAQERTAFSPAELQQAVEEARQRGTPEQIQQAIERLQPEPNWQQQNVYLRQDDPLMEPAPPERQAVTGRKAATPEPPVPEATGSDKWVSGIANKFVEPRVAAGQIGEIAPGQGFATKDLVNMGEQMHPEQISQHVSDIMNGKTGSPEQAAAIRFREAQLSERAARASKLAAANPGNAELQAQETQAIQDVTDFHNGPVANLKTSFHAQGMAMQGEHPIDLTTYNGQLENWLRNSNGKPAPDEVKPALKQSAARAKKVVDDATVAEKAFADEVGKPAKTKLPSADEVRAAIMEQMGIGPCIAV